jgi:hypothetical protein
VDVVLEPHAHVPAHQRARHGAHLTPITDQVAPWEQVDAAQRLRRRRHPVPRRDELAQRRGILPGGI